MVLVGTGGSGVRAALLHSAQAHGPSLDVDVFLCIGNAVGVACGGIEDRRLGASAFALGPVGGSFCGVELRPIRPHKDFFGERRDGEEVAGFVGEEVSGEKIVGGKRYRRRRGSKAQGRGEETHK